MAESSPTLKKHIAAIVIKGSLWIGIASQLKLESNADVGVKRRERARGK
jgi:hypothetical protein